jgi:pSer/pThr/pTyr-binding forkhead associated (FHA) protein
VLGKLYVELAPDIPADSVAGKPLDQWPAFCLKLNPLSLRDALGAPATDATTTTVVVDPRNPTDIREGYGPRDFALLLYELLGGRIREIDSRRYVPLGALGEAGNAVLRRELLAMPHADCESLWRDLLQARAGIPRPTQISQAASPKPDEYRIPSEFLSCVHPGLALALTASNPKALSIHLTARNRFLIGRSAAMADFVARVLPESDVNNARTNRLSRIHACAEIEDGHIVVRDGNGTGPSLNGSFLDGQSLTPTGPTILPHRARLLLGEEYALDLIPLTLIDPPDWKITNIDAWNGPAERLPLAPYAGVVCEPAEGHGLSRQSVWIFSETGFGLDPAGRIIWDSRGRRGSPASFHYHRGCFWLRNHSLADPIFVGNDTALGWGEIIPLVPGQKLRLGAQDFTIHIE